MESPHPVQETENLPEVPLRFGGAVIRLAFFAMMAGWFWLGGNFFNQDITRVRNRGMGVAAASVGVVATVVFVVVVVVACSSGWRAVMADCREPPTKSWAVRRDRDRRRRRGLIAARWAFAAGCLGVFIVPMVGVTFADLRKPDDMWPKDQLRQFPVVVDDAGTDADELERVLQETADRLGFNNAIQFIMSREKCRLPDGSVGMYLDFSGNEYYGTTDDPSAVVGSVAEYWAYLGYSVGEVHEAPKPEGPSFSFGASSHSGGSITIMIRPGSTRLSGHSGCSAVDGGAP